MVRFVQLKKKGTENCVFVAGAVPTGTSRSVCEILVLLGTCPRRGDRLSDQGAKEVVIDGRRGRVKCRTENASRPVVDERLERGRSTVVVVAVARS